MEKKRLVERLMATFIGEMEGHVRALERDLLALEKADAAARADLFLLLFRSAHSLKGAARSVGVAQVESACHRLEEIFAAAQSARLALDSDFFALCFVAADALGQAAADLRDGKSLADSALESVLPALTAAAKGEFQARTASPESALRSSEPARVESTIRLASGKLDSLLVQSGELLIAERRSDTRIAEIAALQDFAKRWQGDWRKLGRHVKRKLAQANGAKSAFSPRALQAIDRAEENFRKLERELQSLGERLVADRRVLQLSAQTLDSEVRRARLLPFALACEPLERTIRDLTASGEKRVSLSVSGGRIELDRSILDGLKDPLLHLVRNALDHGIEPVAEREQNGKPGEGAIAVSASLRGNFVEICVTDDGRGLDLPAIENAARRKSLSIEDVKEAIFLPGLSTSAVVSELSGRGVGLDVVKTSVEAMRGTVEVSFEKGKFTRFALTLPLTLTTIRALLVRAGAQIVAVDAANVRKLARVTASDIRSVEGRDVVLIADQLLPLARLSTALGAAAHEAIDGSKLSVVVLGAGARQAAFLVSELLAERDLVVRNLGKRVERLPNISAATLLSDGSVALILNAAELVATALRAKAQTPLAETLAATEAAPRRRLLVVDDSLTTRTLEKTILESSDFDVLVAGDGAEAWQILQDKDVDLVVSDIEMPKMDGFALTEAIRASKRLKSLPVVLVTALETDADKARGLRAGADAYLLKSGFDQSALIAAISQLL